MTTTNPEKKESILKSLAIAGLLGITVLIAWLAIQIVQVFPAALSSLVTMANSVYNYNPLEVRELELVASESLVNTGEDFSVSFNRPHASGTYVFSYACQDDTKLDLKAGDKTFTDLNCEEQYDLGLVDKVDLAFTTGANRFTDVTYTIAFYRPNGQTPAASQSKTVTVVDARVALSDPTSTTTPTESTEVVPPVVVTTPVVTETPEVPTEPKPVATTPTYPAPVLSTPTFTYAIPTSNPNGTTDLVVSFLSVGRLSNAGKFTSTSRLEAGETGAFQFAVHNIGNRTSQTWTYKAELPDGTTYTSNTEKALLPNERAVITIGFPALRETARTAKLSVTISTDRDTNLGTNSVTKTLEINR